MLLLFMLLVVCRPWWNWDKGELFENGENGCVLIGGVAAVSLVVSVGGGVAAGVDSC